MELTWNELLVEWKEWEWTAQDDRPLQTCMGVAGRESGVQGSAPTPPRASASRVTLSWAALVNVTGHWCLN